MKKYYTVLFLAVIIIISGCATTPSGPTKPTGTFVWPIPPGSPKIKWITQWSERYDFGKPNEVLEFLIGKERTERLRRPNGVVADAEGNIYVADSEIRTIFVFDMGKKTLRFLGMGTVAGPIGLAIDNKRGILFVSDSRLDKVFGFDKITGDIVISLGGPGEFRNPSGLAYDDQRDRLYVADSTTPPPAGLIKRLIKAGARVSYHTRRWYVHVASAFPLAHHYRAVLAWGP